ncbi:MAG: hypothetical protein COV44_02130 [Deltaproteobacteria bacterium CG11_big_fil_rev_8_21_14_0_20_45_16]|nr:MAG: hypothetical protein COV44_02130 [Deltaproteobacteria bacterium CG11_big_fil_rev_8_21_14_0_20_45_16]
MILTVLFLIQALDPQAHLDFEPRDLAAKALRQAELTIGTPTGEESFTYEFQLDHPILPEPKILDHGNSVTWIDYYILSSSSKITLANKKLPMKCVVFFGTADRQRNSEPFKHHIEVILRSNENDCQIDRQELNSKNTLLFSFDPDQSNQIRGISLTHLFNRFAAVQRTEIKNSN